MLKKNIISFVILILLITSCDNGDKESTKNITTPENINFNNIVKNKTFLWENREINFNENSIPNNIDPPDGKHDDKDDNGNDIVIEFNTSIIFSSTTRAIYERKGTIKLKDTGELITEGAFYLGYEIKDNGSLLYSVENKAQNTNDIEWRSSKIIGILNNRTKPVLDNPNELSSIKGYWISTTPYNVDENLGDFYYGIKIGDNPAELYLLHSSKIENIKTDLERDNNYGDIGTINDKEYSIKDTSKSYIYKYNNHYIIMVYVDLKEDTGAPSFLYKNYDITINSDGTISIIVDGDTETSLIFEKYIP